MMGLLSLLGLLAVYGAAAYFVLFLPPHKDHPPASRPGDDIC
jgi:hypothetical protein